MKYVEQLLQGGSIFGICRLKPAGVGVRAWGIAIGLMLLAAAASAQSSEQSTTVRGVVVNSATREPVPRALVVSNDNLFATLTDDQGRFAFVDTRSEKSPEPDSRLQPAVPGSGRARKIQYNPIPRMLSARKPGFLPDSSGSTAGWNADAQSQDLTLFLVPEARIVGKVNSSDADLPASVQLQLYRRLVQGGRARWVFAKSAHSRLNGEFRFAELPAGTYKLFSAELMDRDSQTFSTRGQPYGYPPAYYPSAAGFDSAAEIRVSAGETSTANLSLTRQPYYSVKVPVINAPPGSGFNVSVFPVGHRGPGYSLGYSMREQAIRGMLPSGFYTIEATSYGQDSAVVTASGSLAVRGGPATGSPLALTAASSIQVQVREEFTSGEKTTIQSFNYDSAGRRVELKGPRRYLNVMLEPADDFNPGRVASLRDPVKGDDQSLVLDSVAPGHYWVRVTTMRGYVASLRSGAMDLLQQPLVVGAGGSNPSIEVTLRDETGEIEGSIEGVTGPANPGFGGSDGNSSAGVSLASSDMPAHVYCIPLPDSSGSFSEAHVSPDGTFQSAPLAPGSYRVLAFDRPQSDLEYGNPEAMRPYESKGQVVRLAGGQKERVRLQLIREEE